MRTIGSAFAEFQENEKGTITPGKLADLVILSRDIFTIDPNEIEKVKVGSRVKIEWVFEERPRVVKLEVLKAPPEDKDKKDR